MKKFAAMILALMLVMGLCASAFAAGSISLAGEKSDFQANHTYKVYQIFTGDLSEGNVLSNVKYGENYGTKGAAVDKSVLDGLVAANDARAFAKTLTEKDNSGSYINLHGDPVDTLTSPNFATTATLADGYYLIVDTATGALAEGDAMGAYIVQVLGSETSFKVKKDYPSSDKKITADEHPNTVDGGDSNEDPTHNPGIDEAGKTDNVSIGDKVTYTITAKVPENSVDYDYYYFIIADTLSPGLSFGEDANHTVLGEITSVKVGDTEMKKLGATGVAEGEDEYALYTGADAGDYTFKIALTKANTDKFAGKTITVTYTATLNENAVIAGAGNPNTEKVIYSNDPNTDYDGTNDDDKPGLPRDESNVPLGETPDSITKTFTSGIELQKLDQDRAPLQGAQFTITGKSINKFVRSEDVFTAAAEGEYYKLKNNTYTKDAPITEDQYVALGADEPRTTGYISDGNGGYRVINDGEQATHKLVKANSDQYTDPIERYNRTTTTTVESTTSNVSQNLTVDADGKLIFKGLGAGEYTIHESVTPAGYTTAADVKVIIEFDNTTKAFTAYLNSVSDANKITVNATTNLFPVEVINTKGHPLPETGGVGTKLLGGLGALLMVGTAVLLVSKRRANG